MTTPPEILNFALSQDDRLTQATQASRLKVDDRSLAELLSLAVHYGRLIRFYDLSNAPDEDWSEFYSTDPTIALALQASLQPQVIEDQMQTIGRRLRPDDNRPLVQADPWRDLVALIRQLLSTLRCVPLREGPLATLLHQVESPAALVDSATNLSRFLETTGLDLRLGNQALLLKESELRRLENLLRDFLGVLLASLESARKDAEQQLQQELLRSGHPPHVALYIAFIRLFQSIQTRLNQFPDALLDFYHRNILFVDDCADDDLQRDHLMLAFRLKAGTEHALLPDQTSFSAGVDAEGLPIVFTTDQDLDVQLADVQSLESIRVKGHTLRVDGKTLLNRLDEVWWTSIAVPLPFPAVGPQVPLFGYPSLTESRLASTRPGVPGFAIGSPLLALEGGERLVTLTLRISAVSLRALAASAPSASPAELRERVRHSLERSLRWNATIASGLQELEATARILSLDQESVEPAAPEETLTIAVAFQLPASAPPWQVNPFWGDQPLLIARLLVPSLTPDASASPSVVDPPDPPDPPDPLAPLATLSLLHLQACQLGVEVRGLPPPLLWSSAGRLDPSQPLPLFGPSPVCGSFFSVTATEITDKPLEEISVRLLWHGLPISRDGFRGHYRGYVLDGDGLAHPAGELFDNGCFRVDLSLQFASPTSSKSGAETLTVPLFQSEPATSPATSAQTGVIVAPSPLASVTTLQRSGLQGISGVCGLRLVLSAPAHAFGDALYAINCQEASRRMALSLSASGSGSSVDPPSASSPSGTSLSLSWPNSPWCPRVASVLLDYRCSTAAITSPSSPSSSSTPSTSSTDPRLRFFHLSPLMGHQPVPWSGAPDIPLFPDLLPPASSTQEDAASTDVEQQAGTVLLTFAQPLRQLSLLFGLTSSGTLSPSSESAPLTVDIWDGTQWQPLPPNSFQDGTSGFRQSGLLRFTLPDDQTTSRLRLHANRLGSDRPDLICLEPNAVSATWQGPGGRQFLNRSLPAGLITAALGNVQGIAEVRQPLPSTGGAAPVSADQRKVALGERLRHKERAIQAEDYAVLLLRAFPVLWQVAVLPARKASGDSEAGCVTIIPIPGPEAATVPDPTVPSCDAAFGERLLRELQPRISPFARVEVASPPYCRIRVHASVVVEESHLASALQQLQSELVRYLSPWPAPDLGSKPKNYFEESAISEFIRERAYIKSINDLTLRYEGGDPPVDLEKPPTKAYVYYTSARQHILTTCLTSIVSTSGLAGG